MKKFIIMLVTVAMLASLSYIVGGNGYFNTQVCAETADTGEKSPLDKQLGILLNGMYDIVNEDEDALGIAEIDMVFDAVEGILGKSDMDNAKAVLEKLDFDIKNSEASDDAKKKLSDYIKTALDIINGAEVPDVSSGEESEPSETSESSETSVDASAPVSAAETESSVNESTGSSSTGMIIGIIACVIAVAVAAVIIIMIIKKRK